MNYSYRHELTQKIIAKAIQALQEAYNFGKGRTQEELAEMCGVSQKHINRLLHEKFGSKFTLDMALSIWEALGNPPETLFSEEAPFYLFITVPGRHIEVPAGVRKEDYLAVPLVEGRIAANPLGEIPGNAIESLVWVYKPEVGGRRNLVAVKLARDADSMIPLLLPGDIIIIDRDDREITPKGMYAVRVDDNLEACAVKRVQLVEGQPFAVLLSENPVYPPVTIPWNEHLIIGRVIWSWTSWVRE